VFRTRLAAAGAGQSTSIAADCSRLSGLLEQMIGNPVVTLNRGVAATMADGPAAGLALLDAVDERLNGHYRLDAVRAHLLEMAGDTRPRWRTIEPRRIAPPSRTALPGYACRSTQDDKRQQLEGLTAQSGLRAELSSPNQGR
jgi:hypothetical protein